jgi:hypothetical protein
MMNILGFLSRKGRARNRMEWRQKWASGARDFRRLRKDWKEERSLHDQEEVVDKQIKEGLEFFDADETFLAVKERIKLFIEEHELLRDMEFIVGVEEDRMLNDIQTVQEKLAAYQGKHPSAELNETANTLHQLLNKFQDLINRDRLEARDVLKDRERFRDQTIWGFTVVYMKVRALAKEGRKDAKKIKSFKVHLMHILSELQKEKVNPQELVKRIRDFMEELKVGEKEMLEELKDLTEIRKYLTVMEFRSGLEDIKGHVDKLEEMKFPQIKQEELKKELQEAYRIVQEAQQKSRVETKVLYKDAKKAA